MLKESTTVFFIDQGALPGWSLPQKFLPDFTHRILSLYLELSLPSERFPIPLKYSQDSPSVPHLEELDRHLAAVELLQKVKGPFLWETTVRVEANELPHYPRREQNAGRRLFP